MSQRVSILSLVLISALNIACSKKILPAVTVAREVEVEEVDFEYLHGRARMILKDQNKEREVKANIRIRKDSVIWMNFSVMGVQGGKALIDKDSITVVSTVNKEYFVFEFRALSDRLHFDVNYDILQAALLGNLINEKSPTDQVSEDAQYDLLEQTKGNLTIINKINKQTKKLEFVEMKELGTENKLSIVYSNFQPVGTKQFPYNGTIDLLYKGSNGVLNNTSITFEYNKAEVGDRELKFPFNIPKKYERR
ncbi:MAG: hypothetical protein RL161_318 [Bacteroidota bacterium]|jgi:hypothetical protein